MADAVTTQVIDDGLRNYVVHLTNVSDGTGETDVTKIDISTLSNASTGAAPTSLALNEASWSIPAGSVKLAWDATTDDTMIVMSGNGGVSFDSVGSLQDPQSSGTTGDVKLSTVGFASNDTYDITLVFTKK